MARTRATAVSALVLALGLTGVAVYPFIGQSASASVTAFTPVEGCDAGEVCETPEVTVTVTTTLGTPTPTQPETTVTKTVTPTKSQKATPTPKSTPTPKQSLTQPTPTQQPVLPSQNVQVPTPEPSQETSVSLPAVAPSDTPTYAPSTDPEASPTDESQALELRNAAPEFDQRTLTQKLSIPALVLVLLALFAVLIFEGRLRRMAHAAAVRKAGPQARSGFDPQGGYPSGPGYTSAGHPTPGYPASGFPGGTAYAPIISFVPVQTYPSGQTQYGAGYQDPAAYGQQGYAPEPPPAAPQEPVVLHPDEFDSYNHPPAEEPYRGAFEPLVPPEPAADNPPASDIPAGGANPYGPTREMPFGPASAAEPGDAEPWRPSIWDPAPRPADDLQDPSANAETAVHPIRPADDPDNGHTSR